jgi:ABC-type Na+ efflux pump permease subunit
VSDLRFSPRATVAKRDLASLRSEKTIVLALLIQLFIAAFSSFLVVGLTSLYEPSSVQGGGVDIGVSGEAREELVAAADEVDGVVTSTYTDADTARAQFRSGRLDAVLVGEYADTGDGSQVAVTATVPDGNVQTTLVVVQLRSVLTQLERDERADRTEHLQFEPLALPAEANASPYFGFTYTVLVPLLLFLPPFISGSVAVDTLTEEFERGTLELLRVAPVSLTDIVDAKAAAMILLAPVQAGVWLLLLAVNGITVGSPLALLVMVAAVATLLVGLGLGLGLVTRDRRQAQLLYSVLALLVFAVAALLPEHPATTVARLAVGSATSGTLAHVVGFAALAVAGAVVVRAYAGRVDVESLS